MINKDDLIAKIDQLFRATNFLTSHQAAGIIRDWVIEYFEPIIAEAESRAKKTEDELAAMRERTEAASGSSGRLKPRGSICDDLAVTGVWGSKGGWFQPDEVSHWAPLPDAVQEQMQYLRGRFYIAQKEAQWYRAELERKSNREFRLGLHAALRIVDDLRDLYIHGYQYDKTGKDVERALFKAHKQIDAEILKQDADAKENL
jgi:hypothetical protein